MASLVINTRKTTIKKGYNKMKDTAIYIKTIEQIGDSIKNGEIDIDSIEVEDSMRSGKVIISYRPLPKKIYKSQRDIYTELYDDEYRSILFGEGEFPTKEHIDKAVRKATQYATKNTVKFWREQYVK